MRKNPNLLVIHNIIYLPMVVMLSLLNIYKTFCIKNSILVN